MYFHGFYFCLTRNHQTIFNLFLHFYVFCVCWGQGEASCGTYAGVSRLLVEVGSHLLLYGARDVTQVAKLGGKCPCPLSHLSSP